MEATVSGFGDEFRLFVATEGAGRGGGTVRVRGTALFDIINPPRQGDLEVEWTFADSGPNGTGKLQLSVGKQNTSETVGLPFTQDSSVGSGSTRIDLGSHEYVVLEVWSADSNSSGSNGDSSWSGEITVRLVE